jgi:exopolyphosphatase/guanosine-5'-triphosphate,3'-diphosphate pyrophosphatase
VPETVAAIDCGSNSTRALIVDENSTTLTRQMTITRLAEGVDESKVLLDSAMERTFVALRRYRQECDAYSVSKGLLVATSAVRDATNGGAFLSRASEIMGFEATILSGTQEASLSYKGATLDLAYEASSVLVVDVGGGSSELAFRRGEELLSYSMQLGCVRVSERALGRGVVSEVNAGAARSMIARELDAAFAHVPGLYDAVAVARLVGLAGTVATLAQLDAGISVYDREIIHHRVLDRSVVQYWRDRLGAETSAERLAHPGMVPGREDVLTAGLFVLDAVMERFEMAELLCSESDILDGVTSTLLAT